MSGLAGPSSAIGPRAGRGVRSRRRNRHLVARPFGMRAESNTSEWEELPVGMWDRLLEFLGFGEGDEGTPSLAGDGFAARRSGWEREEGQRVLRPVLTLAHSAGSSSDMRRWQRWAGRAASADGSSVGGGSKRSVPSSSSEELTGKGSLSPDLIVLAPRAFEDARVAADHLRAGRPVVLALEHVERELTQRLIQFLSGSVYALGGEIHRISGHVLLLTPSGFDVRLMPADAWSGVP